MNKNQENKAQSVTHRSNHDKKPGKDIAQEPELKELIRMIRAGELDPDGTVDHMGVRLAEKRS